MTTVEIVVPVNPHCEHDWYCIYANEGEGVKYYLCTHCSCRRMTRPQWAPIAQLDLDWLFEQVDADVPTMRIPWWPIAASVLTTLATGWLAGWW
jgi:hypothetical protein